MTGSGSSTPWLGYAAILESHREPDVRLRPDVAWISARDLLGRAESEVTAPVAVPAPTEPSGGADAAATPSETGAPPDLRSRTIVGVDHLTSTTTNEGSAAHGFTALRVRLAAGGFRHVLPFGDCGELAAEVIERGFIRPGDLAVASDPAGHAIGGIGALFVTTDAASIARGEPTIASPAHEPGEVLESGAAPLVVVLHGERERWVEAIDLALGIEAILASSKPTPDLMARGASRPIELGGPALRALSVADRLVLCGALGARRGAPVLAPVDASTIAWLRARSQSVPDLAGIADDPAVGSPAGAIEIAIDEMLPCLSSGGSHAEPVCDLPSMRVDAVLVGGAFGARIEDLRQLARMLRENPVHHEVRLVVVPATPRTLVHAAHEGLLAMLLRAGARIEAPCSRTLEEFQRALIDSDGSGLTTAFEQPLGTGWSLASTSVCAASAILGRLAHPDEVLRRRKESV